MTRDNQKNAIAAFIEGLLLLLIVPPAGAVELRSPDDRIAVDVDLSEHGQPRYSVSFDGETIVEPSLLGLRFEAHAGLDTALRIIQSTTSSDDETWEQPWGERREVRSHYNELSVQFESTQGPERHFAVVVRAFNGGIGLRYEIPEQPYLAKVAIVDELTEFAIDLNADAWWIPGRGWNRYEFLYRHSPASDIALAHTPATFRTDGGVHLSIHEAALVDYPAFVLDQRREVFKTNLTPWASGIRSYNNTPFVTPWRTIQISADAKGLLNSDLILNLNEPNKLGDVSWVEPGKYVGIWWAMHLGAATWELGPKHGATTAEAKRYVDFAAENGFDGVLVEGWNEGWDGDWFRSGAGFSFTESYPDFDLEEVAQYALEKGVRLIGHHETSGHITNYEGQLDDALDLYQSLGVRQIKTGYVANGGELERVDKNGVTHFEWHDGQFGVNHYTHVLEQAAKRQISINTHEPIKATGLRRTYPNWISREGARGQEFNAWWQPPNPPSHEATLVYTRMLGGPMDFTPGIFDLTFKGPDSDQRVQSTLMKQLALYVVLYSPIQMAADLPENYARFPDAFQFIRGVPTDWEQSVALAGEVGEFVVFARRERGGCDWYLGAVTDANARTVVVPLGFLDSGMQYEATIYRDGDDAHWRTNPYDYRVETSSVDNESTLELTLAAGGGAAVRFVSIDQAD